MVIVVQIDDIEKQFQPYFKFGTVKSLSVDYATNAIHGYIGDEENIVFRFDKWGIRLDNRKNSHIVTGGPGGILIQVD